MTLIMALLLLISLVAMVRSNATMDAVFSSGHPNVISQKLQVLMSFFAPRAITVASALPVKSSLASLASGSTTKSLSVTTSSRNIKRKIERTTDKMSEVTSGKTHAHAIFTKRTERELAAVDSENVEATEDATVMKSFPIRRPVSSMGPIYAVHG